MESWCRPKLLLEEEFTGAQIAATKLSQLFPETDLGLLVEKAPLLIVEDVDEIVAELRRSSSLLILSILPWLFLSDKLARLPSCGAQ